MKCSLLKNSIFHSAIVAISFLIGLFAYKCMPYEIIGETFKLVQSTATLVLAILGAWIAVLFPFLFGKEETEVQSKKIDAISIMLHNLFKPLRYSLMIIMFSFLAPFAKIVITLSCPPEYLIYFRYIGSGCLFSMTCIMLYTLILTFDPFNFVKTTISLREEHKKTTAGYEKKAWN